MIGLYYLVVIAVWLMLTCLMLAYLARRIWRSIRQKTGARWNFVITTCFALVTLAWLAASFWYGGGRKYYYDAEVNRLCAIDGGIKVYKTVKVSPSKFNAQGYLNFYQGENALNSEYIYKSEETYYRYGEPELYRRHSQLIRRSDKKLLGESVHYIRRGGDFPGPMFPSSFRCPSEPVGLMVQVFIP